MIEKDKYILLQNEFKDIRREAEILYWAVFIYDYKKRDKNYTKKQLEWELNYLWDHIRKLAKKLDTFNL